MSAKRENWTPSKVHATRIKCGCPRLTKHFSFNQVYRKVQLILQPWPHLLKLFTEFLEPQDCIEANAVSPVLFTCMCVYCELHVMKTSTPRQYLEHKQNLPLLIGHCVAASYLSIMLSV